MGTATAPRQATSTSAAAQSPRRAAGSNGKRQLRLVNIPGARPASTAPACPCSDAAGVCRRSPNCFRSSSSAMIRTLRRLSMSRPSRIPSVKGIGHPRPTATAGKPLGRWISATVRHRRSASTASHNGCAVFADCRWSWEKPWSRFRDLNSRPAVYESAGLITQTEPARAFSAELFEIGGRRAARSACTVGVRRTMRAKQCRARERCAEPPESQDHHGRGCGYSVLPSTSRWAA